MNVASTQLRTVIKVKEFLEKKAQRELHKIEQEHVEGEEMLAHLQNTNNSAMDEVARTIHARATELQARRAFLQSLRGQIERQEQKLKEIEQHEESKREELVETTQSKKMIEKLYEKRQSELIREQERKEQKLIDVLAQRVYAGNKS